MSSPGLGYVRNKQLAGAITAATSIGVGVDVRGTLGVTIYWTGTGTTSGGTLVLETADYDPNTEAPYAGTWFALQTVNAADVSGGKTKAVYTVGCFSVVRTRIATDITGGGSISTTIIAV